MSPAVSSPVCTSSRLAVLALSALIALGGIAACGEDERPTEPEPEATIENGKTNPRAKTLQIAALGDSITAGSPLFDPNPALQQRLGPALDKRSQYEFWANRTDPRLEFNNCGVFGERTDQIADRLDGCAKGADVLIVQGGINNIAQLNPIKPAAEDLRAMVKTGKEMGLKVLLAEVLPWSNGHPAADEPIARLNREIRRIGKLEGVPVLGFHDALENPAEPGTMSPELTIDGDHPSIAGYRRLGALVSDALR